MQEEVKIMTQYKERKELSQEKLDKGMSENIFCLIFLVLATKELELQMAPWPPLLERGRFLPVQGSPYIMFCMCPDFLIICFL